MIFNVAQLLKEAVGATRTYELHEEADLLPDVPAIAPYAGSVRLVRLNQSVLVTAQVDTRVRLSCSRCLGTVEQPLHIEFTEEFRPTIDIATGSTLPTPEDQDTFVIDERHTLDLTEAVRQYALINLPLVALCREDCAGLCPVCGQDLNVGRCECQKEAGDPRLAALAELLAASERS